MENIEIMVSIIVVLGVLAGIFYRLQMRSPPFRRAWTYVAGTISVICLIVIILLLVQICQPETRERAVSRYKLNEHCEGPQDVRWTIKASEGWEIDVTSIAVKATSVSSQSSYIGVQNETKNGFDIVGRVVNSGKCIKDPITGTPIIKDGRGSLRVQGKYNEMARR